MTVIVIIGVITLVKDSWCGKTRRDPPPISWIYDLKQGREAARREDKPMLIFVGASWDMSTHHMLQSTFTDPDVRAIVIDSFVPIQIDATDDEDPVVIYAKNELHILGLPTILILRRDDIEARHFYSLVEPRTLVEALESARRIN